MNRHFGYLVAWAAIAGALLVCALLGSAAQGAVALLIFLGAVALVAWLEGLGPGLLTAAGGGVFSALMFPGSGAVATGLASYALCGLIIVALGTVRRWNQHQTRLLQRHQDEMAERELLATAAIRLEKARIERAMQSASRSQQIYRAVPDQEPLGAPRPIDPLATLANPVEVIRDFSDTIPTRH